MGETEVGEGVKPGQKVNLEAERERRRAQEKAPRAREKSASPSPKLASDNTALERQLKDFYTTLVGAMFFLDRDVAEFQAKHIDRLAVTQAAWARDNAFVRRFLETLTSGGVAGAAIIETGLVVGGSVLIVQAKRGQLDPRFIPFAGFVGIDIPAPMVPTEEEPPQPSEDNPYDVAANGGGLRGPDLGATEEQVGTDQRTA